MFFYRMFQGYKVQIVHWTVSYEILSQMFWDFIFTFSVMYWSCAYQIYGCTIKIGLFVVDFWQQFYPPLMVAKWVFVNCDISLDGLSQTSWDYIRTQEVLIIVCIPNLWLFFQNCIFCRRFFMALLVLHGEKLSVRGAPLLLLLLHDTCWGDVH